MEEKLLIFTKELVLEHEKTLFDAIVTNNVAQIDQVLHQDLLFVVPGGQVITKAMDLDMHTRKQVIVHKLVVSEENISIIGSTAVVTFLLATKGIFGNQMLEGTYRYIRIWKRFGESLKVIAGSCMLVN